MSEHRDLLSDHAFIQKSIDLLAGGAAWGTGEFYIPAEGFTPVVKHNISEHLLKELAFAMLVEGRTPIDARLREGTLSIEIPQPADPAPEGFLRVEILRQTSSFDEPGQSILTGVRDLVQVSETLFQQLKYDPDSLSFAKRAMDSVHSALSVPAVLLDQSAVDSAHLLGLKGALILYRGEVQSLRHNLRFGLSNLADDILGASGKDMGMWWWNEDFIPQGGLRTNCINGPAYQVFSANGLDLHPVRNDELGALEIMKDSGLISNQSYGECRACYGI